MLIKAIYFVAISLLTAISAISQKLYVYDEDSVMQALPGYQQKQDSLTSYTSYMDSILTKMRQVYSHAKHEQDSLHKAHDGCPAQYCHHIADSVENEEQYIELVKEETRIIDSMLTQRIRDTMLLYIKAFAQSKNYPQVIEKNQIAVMPVLETGQNLDVTQELIAYMKKRRQF